MQSSAHRAAERLPCSPAWRSGQPSVDGQILYNGEDIEKTGLAAHRKNHVAFIFQSYNLIDYLTPRENVALTSIHVWLF